MTSRRIFVTHDQEEALELADSIVVMNKGRVDRSAPQLRTSGERVRDSFVGPVKQARRQLVRRARHRLRHEPKGSTGRRRSSVSSVSASRPASTFLRDDGERLHVQLTA